MKLKILIIVITFILAGCTRDELGNLPPDRGREATAKSGSTDYYWGYKQKIYIAQVPDKYFVLFEKDRQENIASALTRAGVSVSRSDIRDYEVRATMNVPAVEAKFKNCCWSIIKGTVPDSLQLLYLAPYYVTESGAEIGLTNHFDIKLKSAEDIDKLNAFAQDNRVWITGNSPEAPLWYSLVCTKDSKGNALDLSNDARESGLFACTAVSFIDQVASLNTESMYNDPLYNDQWNLKNHNTEGLDIDFEGVHSITSGNTSVVVAVIDNGPQLDHPDLVVDESWDAYTGKSPARVFKGQWDFHGTATNSIIGATTNNHKGIVGIAPHAKLMAISVNFSSYVNWHEQLADAMFYAVNHGAWVISNSWTLGSYKYSKLSEAIDLALTKGRDGKGCVVVFGSGNDGIYTDSSHPVCEFQEILNVGNMSKNGKRYVSSNYGPTLDIVAPGEEIPFLKLNGSAGSASGTSFSCPQAAAVAALILSVAPELKGKDVIDIIESTAKKLDGYSYQSKPNGVWNAEVGYGLLSAYNAVAAVSEPLYIKHKEIDSDINIIRKSVITENVRVKSGTKVDVATFKGATALPPFKIEAGATLKLSVR